MDYHFEGEVLTGADLAKQLLDINPKLLILIMTGDDSADAPIASLRAGVKDFLQKEMIFPPLLKSFVTTAKCLMRPDVLSPSSPAIEQDFLKMKS